MGQGQRKRSQFSKRLRVQVIQISHFTKRFRSYVHYCVALTASALQMLNLAAGIWSHPATIALVKSNTNVGWSSLAFQFLPMVLNVVDRLETISLYHSLSKVTRNMGDRTQTAGRASAEQWFNVTKYNECTKAYGLSARHNSKGGGKEVQTRKQIQKGTGEIQSPEHKTDV